MDKVEKLVRKEAKAFIKKLPYGWGYRLLWRYVNASDGSLGMAMDRMIDDSIHKMKIMKHDSAALPGATSDPDQGYPTNDQVDLLNRRSHP
jgi:hypothetical protein